MQAANGDETAVSCEPGRSFRRRGTLHEVVRPESLAQPGAVHAAGPQRCAGQAQASRVGERYRIRSRRGWPGNGVVDVERTAPQADELGQVRGHAELSAEVPGECSNVVALRHYEDERQRALAPPDEIESFDANGAWWEAH